MHVARYEPRQAQLGGPGGLSGKARRSRYRGRALRLYTQQLIEEFLEPEPHATRRDRFIPIGRRSEFLPSATVPGSEMGDEPARREAVRFPADRDRPKGVPVVRPPKPPNTPERSEPVTFTTRGFLCGCAMGSAAAAVILLLIPVVLP